MESFCCQSVAETTHSTELSERVSESSSVSRRSVRIQMESVSTLQMSSFDFKLSASPNLLMEMSDVCVNSGERAEFSCSFDGLPLTGVVWDHDGQSLVDTERIRSSQEGGMLSLVIQGAGVADQGVYRCTATNPHGQSSSSAQLTVEGASSFIFACFWSILPFHLLHSFRPRDLVIFLTCPGRLEQPTASVVCLSAADSSLTSSLHPTNPFSVVVV